MAATPSQSSIAGAIEIFAAHLCRDVLPALSAVGKDSRQAESLVVATAISFSQLTSHI
jgi:hypothetical protein